MWRFVFTPQHRYCSEKRLVEITNSNSVKVFTSLFIAASALWKQKKPLDWPETLSKITLGLTTDIVKIRRKIYLWNTRGILMNLKHLAIITKTRRELHWTTWLCGGNRNPFRCQPWILHTWRLTMPKLRLTTQHIQNKCIKMCIFRYESLYDEPLTKETSNPRERS